MSAVRPVQAADILRRLPLIIALCVLGTVAATAVAFILPPVYKGQARLVMESPQIPGELAESTVRVAATEQLQIIEQRMLTRAHLLDLASSMRLYEGRMLDASEIVEDMRKRTTVEISDGRDRANLITLSFEAPRPAEAAEVTNAFVSFMLEENVNLRTRLAAQTADFFQLEVQRLDEELQARSNRILEFRLANRDALPDILPELRERQADKSAELQALERQIEQLRTRRAEFVEHYERTGRLLVVVEDSIAPFLRRLSTLNQELDVVRASETSEGARAGDLRSRIAAVERSINAQLVAEGKEPGTIFEHHLDTIDAQITNAGDEAGRLSRELAELGATIDAALANAITLEALERDYQTARQHYSAAISRAAAAETGDLIEALSRGQRITIIEQAVPPTIPERPNRIRIIGAGFVLGAGLGGGIAFMLAARDRRIRRPSDLAHSLGIAPFAVIPHIASPGEAGRRGASAVALAALALVVIGGAGAMIHYFHLPLDLLVQQALARAGLSQLAEMLR